MEENKSRKVIMMSMTGLLIGSLLFIFGASIQSSIVPTFIYYVIAMLLYISSFLATYNNNKIKKEKIYIYIMILSIFFMILITFFLINNFI